MEKEINEKNKKNKKQIKLNLKTIVMCIVFIMLLVFLVVITKVILGEMLDWLDSSTTQTYSSTTRPVSLLKITIRLIQFCIELILLLMLPIYIIKYFVQRNKIKKMKKNILLKDTEISKQDLYKLLNDKRRNTEKSMIFYNIVIDVLWGILIFLIIKIIPNIGYKLVLWIFRILPFMIIVISIFKYFKTKSEIEKNRNNISKIQNIEEIEKELEKLISDKKKFFYKDILINIIYLVLLEISFSGMLDVMSS